MPTSTPLEATVTASARSEIAVGEQHVLRAFVVALHTALRAVRLYPIENTAVRQALNGLERTTETVFARFGECELQGAGDFLFVNGTRLRLQLGDFAAITHVRGRMRTAGIGGVTVLAAPTIVAWMAFLTDLVRVAPDESQSDRVAALITRLENAGVAEFDIVEISDSDDTDVDVSEQERAQQTFMQSLNATRNILTSARMGRSPSLKQAKRAVQGIVDSVMSDETSLMGLTTLREFDEYTFVHSVNVCILSIALGRRLGLNKVQLLDLGLAALMHDIGKSRLPLDVLNKREPLTPEEFVTLQEHTSLGVLSLCGMRGSASRAWRAMTTAYEHHMRMDLTGYPKPLRPRRLSLFSRIVAIADGFDAATSTRVYQPNPWSPADVVRGMRDNQRLGLDPVLVKAFINLTGIYPTGTVVTLDTNELAIVHARNVDEPALSRPIVRLLFDERGNQLVVGPLFDLTAKDEHGTFVRTIVRTENPERFGIRVSDYFM